jgi:hypothetical protein
LYGACSVVAACGGFFGVDFDNAHPIPAGGQGDSGDVDSPQGADVASPSDGPWLADARAEGAVADAAASDAPPSQLDAPSGDSSEACATPCPSTLAARQAYPKAIAIDGANVYWANYGSGSDGSIVAVSKTGGAPIVLAAGQASPTDLAVRGTYVYWTNQGDGTVMRALTTTANSGEQIAFGQSNPTGIKVDDTNVYWTNGGVSADGTLNKAPLGGGAASAIASNLFDPGYFAVDAVNAYLALGTGGVAFTSLAGGDTLHYVASDGMSSLPNQVVLFGDTLYWTDLLTHTVYRAAIDGGGAQGIAGGTEPEGVATDGVSVYWTNRAGGTVNKVPALGGSSVPIASGQGYPWGVAVDDATVYWTAAMDGTVNRAPK